MPTDMLGWLLQKKDPLRPFGDIDVVPYYAAVAGRLLGFLGDREIATKVWIPDGPQLLKRGSKLEPLTAGELAVGADEGFIEARRSVKSLSDAAGRLSPVQRRIWEYFFPRKLCDLFYATNHEGAGRPMDRIFFDIDKPHEMPLQDAAKVAAALLQHIRNDDEFNGVIGRHETFPMFTGSSFHVYLLLRKGMSQDSYDRNLHFSKADPAASFTGRWAQKITSETGISVIGGHEKARGVMNIDPSQTPSGKLARCPFSLHMKDARTVDGVALPLGRDFPAGRPDLRELLGYTPRKVLENLDELSGNLPRMA